MSPVFQGPLFDPFPLGNNPCHPTMVDIGWRRVIQRLMVQLVIVAIHEGLNLNPVIIRAGGSNAAPDSEPETDVDNPAIAGINNFPNPFNPTTEIRFSLAQQADVKLEIFNIMGQRVSILVDRRLDAGLHSLEWEGLAVASGVYFYRLTTSDFTATRKMILLK